ncbi:MAG: hypothetical protein WA114_04700 [Psychrobacter glacincola]
MIEEKVQHYGNEFFSAFVTQAAASKQEKFIAVARYYNSISSISNRLCLAVFFASQW